MNVIKRNFRYWVPVLVWLGVIAYESLRLSSLVTGSWLEHLFGLLHIEMAPGTFALVHHLLRKGGHVCGYGVLNVLLFRAWFHSLGGVSFRSLRLRCAVLATSMTLLTAILDEWHQAFDPTRTSSPWDVLLDLMGGVIFLSTALFIFRMWRAQTVVEFEPVSVA